MTGRQAIAPISSEAFVGRDVELGRLRAAIEDAAAGRGGTVLIGGEPGIGKTSLIRQGLGVQSAGIVDHWAWLDRTVSHPPLWPWLELLRQFEGTRARSAADPENVLEAIERHSREASAGAPIALVIEDLQWADRPSLDGFVHLARLIAGHSVVLIGTYRDSELSPAHPLTETLVELQRLPPVDVIRLRTLPGDAVRDYVRRTLGSTAELERIVERADGNPYYMVELVRALASPDESSATAVPVSVRQALELRLARRSAECRDVLEVAALIGRDFSLELLGRAFDDREIAFGAVEEGVESGLLVEREGGARFVHALMQDTVRAGIPRLRGARLHAAIAGALRVSASNDDPSLAQHLLEAALILGDDAREAGEVALRVATDYEARGAWEQAALLYRQLLTLQERDGDDAKTAPRGALLLRLGRCYLLGADPRHAETHRAAFAAFREVDDHRGMAQAVLEASPPAELNLEALANAEETIGLFEGEDSEVLARLLAQRAVHLWDPGADAAAARARGIADRLELDGVRALLLDRETHAAFVRLDLPGIASAASEAFALFERLGRFDEGSHMLADIAWSSLFGGALDAAYESADRALRHSVEHRVEPYEQVAAGQLATIALLRDDRAGVEAIAEAHPSWMPWLPFLRAWRADLEGDYEAALAFVPEPAPTDPPANFARTHAARARLAHRAGDDETAAREFARWRALLPETIMLGFSRPSALPEIDDAVVALGEPRIWAELNGHLEEWSAVRLGAGVPTSLDYLRGTIALALERPADARNHFVAGRAWAERERCPLDEARCIAGLGRAAAFEGDRGSALRLLESARQALRDRGAPGFARTVEADLASLRKAAAPDATRESQVHLTPRQLDVMRLLARGATNTEIAEVLVLSPHTVANYLKRIREKTGSDNRTAAAAFAVRLGLDRD